VKVISKLRGRSPHELAFRTAQWLSSSLERAGFSADLRLGEVDAALAPALPGWRDPRRTATRVRALDPSATERLLADADACVAGRIALLGYGRLPIGTAPDWHRDVVSGRRAPDVHWSRIPYLDPSAVGDHKVTWELSRLQFLVRLGQAHALTGEKAYADRAERYMRDWIAGNPPKRGINWVSSLELAYRAIAWTWTMALLGDALSPTVRRQGVALMRLHARHVERHLSYYFSPNTHLTGEALGLLYVGSAFGSLPEAGRWCALGWRILAEQLPLQVHADGVYGEQSLFYQRYVADIYLHAIALRRQAGQPDDPAVVERLGRVLEVLAAVRRPDGSVPLVGDEDGGQLLALDIAAANDVRPTLALGAQLLGRPELAHDVGAAAIASCAWVLGSSAVAPASVAVHPGALSAFPEGGLFVVRPDAGDPTTQLLLDAGPLVHPRMGGAHAHADALSVDVTVDGHPMLIDPGTGSYADPAVRCAFREAGAHNVILVDGGTAARSDGPFRWRHAVDAHPARWTEHDGVALAEARWDGHRADRSVKQARSVFGVGGLGWVVRDHVDLPGSHELTLPFHLAPGLEPVALGDDWRLAPRGGRPMTIGLLGAVGTWQVEAGQSAPAYGRLEPSAVLTWRGPARGQVTLWTLLAVGDVRARRDLIDDGTFVVSWAGRILTIAPRSVDGEPEWRWSVAADEAGASAPRGGASLARAGTGER
jgi:hypothetical protein